MTWTVHAEIGVDRWTAVEDPASDLLERVVGRWLPLLEAVGPFDRQAEVGQLLFEDRGFLALQLPDAIALRHVAEGFVDPTERLFVILRISSAHP